MKWQELDAKAKRKALVLWDCQRRAAGLAVAFGRIHRETETAPKSLCGCGPSAGECRSSPRSGIPAVPGRRHAG